MTPALHIASDPQGTKKPGPASSSKSSAILSGANRIQVCSIIRHYVNDLSGDRTGVCYPIAESIALAKEEAPTTSSGRFRYYLVRALFFWAGAPTSEVFSGEKGDLS